MFPLCCPQVKQQKRDTTPGCNHGCAQDAAGSKTERKKKRNGEGEEGGRPSKKGKDDPKANRNDPHKDDPQKNDPKKGDPKGNSKDPKGDPTDPKGSGEPQKKELANMFREAESLKTQMKTVLQDAADLLSLIAVDQEYSWARPDEFLADLRKFRKALDQIKNQNTFWRDWSVQDSWSKWVKKEKLNVELTYKQWPDGASKVKSAVSALDREVRRIKNMHRSRNID